MPSNKKEFAPGIRAKKDLGDLSKLKSKQLVTLLVQQHKAERAGQHLDIRVGTPDTGLYSWATKQKKLPEPGERGIELFRQPLHSWDYKNFEGPITAGYGKGDVVKQSEGTLLINKVTDKSLHFSTADERYPQRYILIKPKDETKRGWLLLNTTPTKITPYVKLHYDRIAPEQGAKILKNLQPGSSVQMKIDGAASLIKLLDKKIDIISYRTSKTTDRPIIHTERVLRERPEINIPSKYRGSVLKGEIYGVDRDGNAIAPHELGGLLNSTIENSLRAQEEKNIKLKTMLYDLQQLGNKTDTSSMPYSERYKLLQDIAKVLPKRTFHIAPQETTSAGALRLLKDVKSGKNPLTREGLVVHPSTGKPSKIKFTEDHDVFIRDIFPAEGKYKHTHAGGFLYSMTPRGKIVGKVGTGFSDAERKDLHDHPEEWVGRVAQVKAQNVHTSGALRAPSFQNLHPDYPSKGNKPGK